MKKGKKEKIHLKKGDMVQVIAGNEKGKTGSVILVDTLKKRAIVKGLNLGIVHKKPTQKSPRGGRFQRPMSIAISNLMLFDTKIQEPTRVGRKVNAEGKLQRYSKKTGNFI